MKKLIQPFTVEIGGKVFCLGHGDGLGPVPFGYRFLRGVFHNRFLQRCFSLLHPWIAFRLGNGWSKNNRLARNEEYDVGLTSPFADSPRSSAQGRRLTILFSDITMSRLT